MASVLVCGGAGYIGSTVAVKLQDLGHNVFILDNLSTGHRQFVLDRSKFIECNTGDQEVLDSFLKNQKIDAVFHFAALSIVPESIQFEDKYLDNNFFQTEKMLQILLQNNVKKFIFSSTCSVYGDVNENITETLPLRPTQPYGESKKRVEELLKNLVDEGMQSISFRYFNASGCESQYRVGENHFPETHLIPNVIKAALNQTSIKVFGSDYPTIDGTGIRDYIHVNDLAKAHILGFEHLLKRCEGGYNRTYNLGSGSGYSVLEIIKSVSEKIGKKIQIEFLDRRQGDVAKLVASTKRIEEELGFYPIENLDSIIHSAIEWEKKKAVSKKAVFLDRDGTLNFDPNYLNNPDHLHLLPGVIKALQVLKNENFEFYVISNQSGIARGFITHDQLHRIHEKLDLLLLEGNVSIAEYALCIHHPSEDCVCRKPKPYWIHELSKKYNIDLTESYMIGDKASDIEFGINAGCKESIFLRSGNNPDEEESKLKGKTTSIYNNLYEFVKSRYPNAFYNEP